MIKSKKNQKTVESNGAASVEKKSLLKREWPLLLYPTLVLFALVVLYTANHSLRNEVPSPTSRPDAPSTPASDPVNALDFRSPDDDSASATATTNPETPETPISDQPESTEDWATAHHPADNGEHPPESAGATGGSELHQTPSTQLLNALRVAIAANDHARIKECMKDLVALGDDAVVSLAELIAGSDDQTALWAAEALARIGTPTATSALLDTLEQTKDGLYKEQLAKRVSGIINHDSWPLLLDAVQGSQDAAVQRAATTSLVRMADTAVVDEIVARYDAATTQEEADLLAQVLSNVNCSEASDALRTLAGDVATTPQDSLQEAAIAALGEIGDPQSVNYLLQRLEASSPGEGSYLYNTITSIDSAQAKSSLLYAAAGNKAVSAEQGRTAAICALENYPSEETCQLLEQIIANEDNTAVVTAALRTLENIEKKEPALVERVASKAETESVVNTDTLKK